MDLQKFIQAVNEMKLNTPLLQGEGTLSRVPVGHPSLLVLSRECEHAPGQRGWIVLNSDWDHSAQLSIHELHPEGAITLRDLTMADHHHPETYHGASLEIQPAGVLFLSQVS